MSATSQPAGRRIFRVAASLLIALALLAAAMAAYFVSTRNFHTVSTGKVYRSAQMSADGFREVIEKYGIQSVINLRGANDTAWYQAETNATARLGARHYDFALSASQEVSVAEMSRIVATLADAPKPILIHCKSGADRTGLVSALYLLTQEGGSPETADGQLTVLCGHFPHLFWRDTAAMDDSFWRYVRSRPTATASRFSSADKILPGAR